MWIKVFKTIFIVNFDDIDGTSDSTSLEASKLNKIFILEKTRGEIHNFELNVQKSLRLD